MKKLLIIALMLSGCTTTSIDVAVQKSAPAFCDAAVPIYETYVAAGFGSAKDKATMQAAWDALTPVCANPTQATALQLAVAAAQFAIMAKLARKA